MALAGELYESSRIRNREARLITQGINNGIGRRLQILGLLGETLGKGVIGEEFYYVSMATKNRICNFSQRKLLFSGFAGRY